MVTFTETTFHELLDSDKTTPSTVLDSDGKLKQSLHNVLKSTDFLDTDEWSHNNVTVTESGTSPSGKKAYLVTETTASGQRSVSEPSALHNYTNRYSCASVDVKRGTGSRHCVFRIFQSGGTIDYGINLDDGTATRTGVGTLDSCIVTELSDGWFNVKMYYQNTNDGFGFTVLLAEDAVGDINYTGDGTSSIYVSRPRAYEASVHVPVERVENGTFDSDVSGWAKSGTDSHTLTYSSGTAILTKDSSTTVDNQFVQSPIPTVAGEKYRISFKGKRGSGAGAARLTIYTGGGSLLYSSNYVTDTTFQTQTQVFTATTSAVSVYLICGGGAVAGTAVFDDVSLTKVIDDGIQNDLDGEDFIETSGSAIYHGGLEYNGDGSFRGIQSFEGRTNLVPHADGWTSTYWGSTGTTQSKKPLTVSGDMADVITEDTANSLHRWNAPLTTVTSGDHTLSLFVKVNSGTRNLFVNAGSLLGASTNFDLSDGTVNATSADSNRIEDMGNDTWRVSITNNVTSGNTNRFFIQINTTTTASDDTYTGDGSSGFIIWGAQVEAGSSPSPYIPTTGSTRNRVKDTIHKDLVEFGFNQNELTVLCEFESAGSTGSDFPWAFCISDGSGDYRYGTYGYVAGSNKTFVFNINSDEGAAINANYESNYTPYSTIRTMFGFKGNDNAVSDDGDTVVTNSRAIPENVNLLNVASENSFSQQLNGHVKKLIIWPKRLANATLEAESV